MPDLNAREYAMFVPLIVLTFWLGVHPATFRDLFAPTVQKIIADYHRANGGEP
jgi:NADH-quinone oxidoreductase subunit M